MLKVQRTGGIIIKPKVSIIIPVFNVEKYILKCIKSVLNQKDFKSFEVIIVNDGTTDSSITSIEETIKPFPNITVIHQENKGLSEARNIGMKHARGEYISFIDSDDWIEPEMISVMYERAVKTKSEIAVCNIRKVYFDESANIENMDSGFPDGTIISSEEAIGYYFQQKKVTGHVCNKIFKSELFTRNNIRFPVDKKYEDMPTCFELFWCSSKIVFVKDFFYNYVQRNESITRYLSSDLWDLIDSVYLIKFSLVQKNKYETYHQKFMELLISKLFAVYIQLRKNKRREEHYLLDKKIKQELNAIALDGAIMSFKIPLLAKVKYLTMKLNFNYTVDFLLLVKSNKNNISKFLKSSVRGAGFYS